MSLPKKRPNTTYRCVCCGDTYSAQRGNFYSTHSALYAANGGYLPVCKKCVDIRFNAVLEVLDGREDLAVENMCQTFDWFFSPQVLNFALTALASGQSVMSSYISRLGLSHVVSKGTSYLDTMRVTASGDPETAALRAEFEEKNAPPPPREVDEAVKRRWGTGYTPDEYDFLEEHYAALSGKIIEGDDVSESLVRDLCNIKLLQNRAANNNDHATYAKYQKVYTDTLKSPDLRSSKTKAGATDAQASWGKYIEMVEKYTPAEYYKDQKLFDDESGIKEYFKRFFVRPFKNFFTGSTEADPEFSVKQEDVDGD